MLKKALISAAVSLASTKIAQEVIKSAATGIAKNAAENVGRQTLTYSKDKAEKILKSGRECLSKLVNELKKQDIDVVDVKPECYRLVWNDDKKEDVFISQDQYDRWGSELERNGSVTLIPLYSVKPEYSTVVHEPVPEPTTIEDLMDINGVVIMTVRKNSNGDIIEVIKK